MRLLFIHADRFEYELREKTRIAEELPKDAPKKESFGETLVAFCSVEEGDAVAGEDILGSAIAAIRDVAGKVKAEKVVLYPYAHLSSVLGKPADAIEILKELEQRLKKTGIDVHRSPFGWYKAFDIKCKGHPLSELSKQIGGPVQGSTRALGVSGGVKTTSVAKETVKPLTREDVVEGISSEFIILNPDGKELKVQMDREWVNKTEGLDVSIKNYILSEELKAGTGTEPPSIATMKRLELVDYEPASDSGNFRLYPKGALVFSLIKDWADWIAHEKLGAMEIDTPILYDWAQPDINAQAKSFHQRHYMVSAGEDKREFVLRFAGDFGLFRIMRDATISYRQLPIRIYEFSKSFRYEQRGELLGLKRLRAFHMPDIHTFAADLAQGWEEYIALYRTFSEQIERTGIEYVNVFRVVKDFYDKYKTRIAELLAVTGKPAFIEVLSSAKHYWVIKNEFQGIDSAGRAYQLSTVQLDLEDAERYGITYADKDGQKKGLVITHSSIGSIERWIYGFLEEALKRDRPYLPFWLAPTQVRFIPVKAEHVADCERIAKSLGIRADIDDRDEKLSRRIRDAEVEWVNMIVVFGDKEKASDKLPVRMRNGEVMQISVEEIRRIIEGHMKDFPHRPLAVPRMLSKTIVFRG